MKTPIDHVKKGCRKSYFLSYSAFYRKCVNPCIKLLSGDDRPVFCNSLGNRKNCICTVFGLIFRTVEINHSFIDSELILRIHSEYGLPEN